MTLVIITLTEIAPVGPPLAHAITPLMFRCGDTISVDTPTVGNVYTVTATMRTEFLPRPAAVPKG